jgi:dienelactone hydrolase
MRRTILVAAIAASLIGGSLAVRAAGKGEAVEYKDGDVALEGYLAMPAGKPKAGVLVVHEWWGLDDYARHRAEQLAELGYAAFALDMYGKGVHTDDPKVATELSGKLRGGPDRKDMRRRAALGLDVLKSKAKTEHNAAIGYCFGGTTVLELARSGAELKGVVSFHGGLATPDLGDAKNIKCKVLACCGGDDGFVSAEELANFEKEMRDAKVDWVLMKFGGANHSFTNPDADKHKIPGLSYNEHADKRSWKAMQDFFDEIFAK